MLRPGLFPSNERKDSPVKAKIMLWAVVLGAVLLALVAADGNGWPGT